MLEPVDLILVHELQLLNNIRIPLSSLDVIVWMKGETGETEWKMIEELSSHRGES